MVGQRSKLQEDVRFRILRLLQENPEISQRQLADMLGISVGGVHYVLTMLVDKGMVKFGNFSAAKDKRRYAYLLTPRGISEKARLTQSFLKRKMKEYDALKAEIASLQEEVDLGDDLAADPRSRASR
ncbi:MarR family EPS-associated transcriptional regulator [Hoeflea sp. CAU 1731]